jgi:hypothetical protein
MTDHDLVRALIAKSKSQDDDERTEAYSALAELDPVPDEAVDALVEALADRDNLTDVADALEQVKSPRAIDALLVAIASERRENPRFAFGQEFISLCRALGACGVGEDRAIDGLLACLWVPEGHYAARGAFEALRLMGPRAARATAGLEALTAHENPWIQVHAHSALVAIDGDLPRHVRALCDGLLAVGGGGAASAGAEIALKQLGTPAIEHLEREAERPNAKRKKKIASVIERITTAAQKRRPASD